MYAGFWKRFAAYIIDSIIVTITGWILFAVLGIILSATPGGTSGNNALSLATVVSVGATLAVFIIGILLNILYFALFESSSAQATPGKMALGIKVTDVNGKRLTFWRAVGRTIAKWVSNLTFSIGYLMAGFTRRRQALHDMLADCLVIDKNADTNNLQPLPPTPVWQIVLIIFAVCILPITLIVGILAAIALPQYFRAVEKSRSVEALSVMNSIAGAQERHRLISGKYTLNFDDLDLDFSERGTVNGATLTSPNFKFNLDSNDSVTAEKINNGNINYTITKCYGSNTCCSGSKNICDILGLTYSAPRDCCR